MINRAACDESFWPNNLLHLCVNDAIGFVIMIIALLYGVLEPMGWLAAAIHLFFAVEFEYFLLPQKHIGSKYAPARFFDTEGHLVNATIDFAC
jgi:hypothetical protein